jgi:hypothetical protein
MQLALSKDDQTFVNLEDVIRRVNEHASRQEYAVVILRTKKFKLEEKRKAWSICDRDRKFDDSEDQRRRHVVSKRVKCSFLLTAKREDDYDVSWSLKMIKSKHNHDSTIVDAYSVHRRNVLTDEIKSEISRQLTVQVISEKMISSLRIQDSSASQNSNDNSENLTIISLLKARDIYNVKTQMRRETLESLTSMQALIRFLNENDWFYQFQKNDENEITHLFFVRESSRIILKTNYEILIMNCIFKINRYKISLLVISDQISLRKNFYVRFCFMTKKTISDYSWILKQLKTVYSQIKFSNLTVIITDMKKDISHLSLSFLMIDLCLIELIVATRNVFSEVHHLFCTWHINNNVLANCKKSFHNKKTWDVFFAKWKTMMYDSSKTKFWENWTTFFTQYTEDDHENCIQYLTENLLSQRTHRAHCYINQIWHFEITVTSRDERSHSVLKKQLKTSTKDLKMMMNKINLLLKNELHNYLINFNETKIRYSASLRKSIFEQIRAYVTFYVLKKILSQYEMLTTRSTTISACTHVVITVNGLSCSYDIQKRLFNEESLLLKDIHTHWR